MYPVQESNFFHTNEEGDTEVVESTTVILIVDTADNVLKREGDAPANMDELPRMVFKSILSSKVATRKKGLWPWEN